MTHFPLSNKTLLLALTLLSITLSMNVKRHPNKGVPSAQSMSEMDRELDLIEHLSDNTLIKEYNH